MNTKIMLSAVIAISLLLGSMTIKASDPTDSDQNGPPDSERMAEIRRGLVDECRADVKCLERNADHLDKTRVQIRNYREGTLNTQRMVATKLGVNLNDDD